MAGLQELREAGFQMTVESVIVGLHPKNRPRPPMGDRARGTIQAQDILAQFEKLIESVTGKIKKDYSGIGDAAAAQTVALRNTKFNFPSDDVPSDDE